jgi:hypothetical protein
MNLHRVRLAATTVAVVLAGLVSLALGQPASATMLADGQGDTAPGVSPDVFSSRGTELNNFGSGLLSDGATYTYYVYKGNTYGASDLTFAFVINPGRGSPGITEATYSDFSGYDVDAGYCSCGTGTLPDPAPTGVGLSTDGSTVDFYFSTPLNTSGNSDYLMIETDSANYARKADVCLMGATTSCSGGFEPTPAPPIGVGFPAVLGVGGLIFGAKLRERNRKRRSLGTATVEAVA